MQNKLENYDVIIFGLTRSEYPLSSVSLGWSKEWAKTNRVFYIDRPFSLKDLIEIYKEHHLTQKLSALFFGTGIFKKLAFNNIEVIQVTPMLSLPINFLPHNKLYKFLNAYNNYLINRCIKKIIKKYHVQNYVFFNSFHPMYGQTVAKSITPQPLANIYQSLDDIRQEYYIAKHGIYAEHDAVLTCDIAIGTSTGLCNRHQEWSGKEVHLLANAADTEHFEDAINKQFDKPEELKQIDKPIIIYTGHYSDLRLNHELVIKTANHFSNCMLVFVGTYVESDLVKFGINKLSNIVFVGLKQIEELPAFLKYSKVAIIPYASNQLTSQIYPLKINEYLAAGIPTVVTNFSPDIASFKDVIYVSNSNDEFIHHIEVAMQENPNERLQSRVAYAHQNSWRMRINKLENIISNYLAAKG